MLHSHPFTDCTLGLNLLIQFIGQWVSKNGNYLKNNDWKMAVAGRRFSVVKVNGEAFITAFSIYFAWTLQTHHSWKTLTFQSRCIVSIVAEGDKPLPVTSLWLIYLLCWIIMLQLCQHPNCTWRHLCVLHSKLTNEHVWCLQCQC